MTDQQYPAPADEALRVIRPAWHMTSACRSNTGVDFFSDDEHEQAAAKAICATCPVQRDCFLWAMRTLEQDGVWGGFTTAERVEIRARQAS